MDKKRLSYLQQQEQRNQCTPQEQAELDAWYQSLDDPDFVPEYVAGTPEADAYIAANYQAFRQRLGKKRPARVMGLWARIAAVLVVGLVIGTLVWRSNWSAPGQQEATNRPYTYTQDAASYTRYITLPDSSVVILSPGSRLEVNRRFGKENRQLNLHGTAYFDVKHNAALPFTIHTSNTKTTVLGTTFSINEAGNKVTVTLTRGSVRVEQAGQQLAVLKPGQQVVYQPSQPLHIATMHQPEAASSWAQQGLNFKDASLGTIVQQLQQRYNARIVLAQPGMAGCRATIIEGFSGAEDLLPY